MSGASASLQLDHRRLFEDNPQPMWVFDVETLAFLDVNEAALRHYGYSREEFLAMTIKNLRPPEDVPRLLGHLPKTRDNPSPGTTRWRHLKRDATIIDVEVTSFGVTFMGKPAKLVVANDVTARARAEGTIRALLSAVIRAQEEERTRVARELHDDTAQSLASLLVELSAIDGARSVAAARVAAAELRRHVAKALDEVQRLARGLRPAALDALGVGHALERLGSEFSQVHGIEVDVHVGSLHGGRLPSPVETALYRIAQEALANAGKHATARTVSVVVQRSPSLVMLIVEDDGRGFDVTAIPARHHLGLQGMRERAALLGGTLSVESTPGRGTTLRASLPLGEAA